MINSNNEELIHHIHCLGYIFIMKERLKTLFDFLGSYFMIFNVNSIHQLPETVII